MNPEFSTLAALTTPYTQDGSIDYRGLEQETWKVGEAGASGFLVCGTTGTFWLQPDINERLNALGSVCRVAVKQRIPVYFQVGADTTAQSVRLVERGNVGVEAFAVIMPSEFEGLSLDDVIRHFAAIIKAAAGTKVLAYFHPKRWWPCDEEITRMFRELSLAGAKVSAVTLQQLESTTRAIRQDNPDAMVFSGNDGHLYGALIAGHRHIVSGNAAAVANIVSGAVRSYAEGKADECQELIAVLNQFREITHNGDISLLHAVQEIMGIIPYRQLREPKYTLTSPERAELSRQLRKIGLLK